MPQRYFELLAVKTTGAFAGSMAFLIPHKSICPAAQLYISDLREVQNEIYSARLKWYNLGLELGLQPDALDCLQVKHHKDPSECLREMLKMWLRISHPSPTWRALVEALRGSAVEELRLAHGLEQKYCSGVENVCDAPAGEAAKTLEIQHEYGSVINYEGVPRKRVSTDGSEESGTSWKSTSADWMTSEEEELQPQAFGCGCRKCSFEDFLEKGCPNPITTMSSFPSLDTKELSHSQQQTLRGKLYHEFEKITTAFSSLFSDTCNSLVQRDISVLQLVLVLTTLGAFQPTLPQMPLLEEQLVEMSKAKNNYEVFFALRGYVSFFSHHIVDHIIAKLGTPEDHQRLQSYRHALDDYMKRSVFECPSYSLARHQQTNLVVKLEGELDRYKMYHLEGFQSRFSNIIRVSEYTLRLCTVERGCLQLTYQVPHFVLDTIFPLSEDQKAMLRAEGVTRLSCGNNYDHLSNQHPEERHDEGILSCDDDDDSSEETHLQPEASTPTISCEGGGRLHLSRQGGMDDGDSDGESTNVQDPTAVLQSLLSEQLQPSPPQPLSPTQLPPLRADSGYESRNLSRHQSIQSPQDPGKKAW